MVKAWVKDNAKGMSLISSSMEKTQLQDLIMCLTANEMWQNLTRMYEQKSASSKLLLMQRYHEYRMGLNDSVVQHQKFGEPTAGRRTTNRRDRRHGKNIRFSTC